jgi:hypothetical protein
MDLSCLRADRFREPLPFQTLHWLGGGVPSHRGRYLHDVLDDGAVLDFCVHPATNDWSIFTICAGRDRTLVRAE